MSWLRRCPGGGASFLRRRSVTQGGETCRQHPCLARADPGNGGKIFRGGGDHGFKVWKMRPQQPLGGWSHAGNPAQFPGQGRLGTGAAVPANSVTVGCIPHMLEKQQLGRTFPQGERVAPSRQKDPIPRVAGASIRASGVVPCLGDARKEEGIRPGGRAFGIKPFA